MCVRRIFGANLVCRLVRRHYRRNFESLTAKVLRIRPVLNKGELSGKNVFRFVRRSLRRKHLSPRTAKFWAKTFRLARRTLRRKHLSLRTANFRAKISFASYGEVLGENLRIVRRTLGRNLSLRAAKFRRAKLHRTNFDNSPLRLPRRLTERT